MRRVQLALCLILVALFIESSSGFWLPCRNAYACGQQVNSRFKQITSSLVSIASFAALGIFQLFFPQLGKRSVLGTGNLEKSLYYFNIAEQVDEKGCLAQVLCEAAFMGKQKNSSIFQEVVSNMAVTIAKRNVTELAELEKVKGGHMVASMLLGNGVHCIDKCHAVSKTCKPKFKREMSQQMEKIFQVYAVLLKSSSAGNETVKSSDDLITSTVKSMHSSSSQ